MKRASLFLVLILALLIAACSGATPPSSPDAPADGGEAPETEASEAPAASGGELNVYNWSTYIAEDTIPNFEQQFGVKVNYDVYESNEDLLAKIQPGNPGYDVIVPSDYMVEIMIAEGLLEPLNKENIPNLANVDERFLDPPYDPGNTYCVPYQWGTAGLGYDSSKIGEIDSWDSVFNPEPGMRIGFLEDARGTIGAALIYLGYDVNTTDPNQIDEAKDLILSIKDQIVAFAPDNGQDLLNQGEVDIQYEYNGDILQIQEGNPNFQYIVPKEGGIIWTDNLCIPKGAPHKEMAETFINYILDPQVGADISNYTYFGTPNKAALEQGLIDPEARENPAIYPPEELMEKLWFLVDVGDDTLLYDDAWTEIKTAVGE